MLRALIFDFDGLIVDTETPLIDAYAEVHARHGVPFDRTVFLQSVGHADYAFDPWHGFGAAARVAAVEHRAPRELFLHEPARVRGIVGAAHAIAADEGEVEFVHIAAGELPGEREMGFIVLRHDEAAAGVLVEPVDNARPRHTTDAAQFAFTMMQQRVD